MKITLIYQNFIVDIHNIERGTTVKDITLDRNLMSIFGIVTSLVCLNNKTLKKLNTELKDKDIIEFL